MSREKLLLYSKIIASNPKTLKSVLDNLQSTEDRITAMLGVFDLINLNQNEESVYQAARQAVEYSNETAIALMKESPFLLKCIRGLQTEELCDVAIQSAYDQDPNNMAAIFMYADCQTEFSVKLAVSGDARSYKHVDKRFKTYDLAVSAVKNDSTVLKDVEGFHTEELATIAIKGWAKAVRWVRCEDPELRDRMQILAIESNLQAMPEHGVIDLSQKVISRFKQLCIESNYFNELWCPTFDLTQNQLYAMLEARKEWIESHKIFRLLDDDYKLKACKAGLLKYHIKFNVNELLGMKNEELISLMLSTCQSDIIVAYFKALYMQGTSLWHRGKDKLNKILSFSGSLLKYLDEEYQTEELCLTAVGNDIQALEFVKVWTDKLLNRLQNVS